MKLHVPLFSRAVAAFSAVLLCLRCVSHAGTAPTNVTAKASGRSPATPATAPVKTEIPKSVFVVPASQSEGRDPFFPRSTRISAAKETRTTIQTNVPAPVVELVLQGISGTRERPLAIINNQTFATGEESDVTAGGRRLRIRCLEINLPAGSATVQVGNERRELRLKPGK